MVSVVAAMVSLAVLLLPPNKLATNFLDPVINLPMKLNL
jgi:hypothetical protein